MSLFHNNYIDLENIYLKPSVYDVLNESRGISMECNIVANNIALQLRAIVNKSRKSLFLKFRGERIGVKRTGQSSFNIFGKKITIVWEYYNFDNRIWLNKFYESIEKTDGFDDAKNILKISLFGVSGSFDTKNCENTIAHEIFHNYKVFKPINHKEHNLAKLANKLVTFKLNTKGTELIGQILYLLSKEEIQAFCNGAYAQIKKEIENGNRLYLEDFIENTILYQNFLTLDKLINTFNTTFNERKYDVCCRYINALTQEEMMPFNSFKKYIEIGRKDYVYQLGRLKSLLVDDFKLEESNIMFEKYF